MKRCEHTLCKILYHSIWETVLHNTASICTTTLFNICDTHTHTLIFNVYLCMFIVYVPYIIQWTYTKLRIKVSRAVVPWSNGWDSSRCFGYSCGSYRKCIVCLVKFRRISLYFKAYKLICDKLLATQTPPPSFLPFIFSKAFWILSFQYM